MWLSFGLVATRKGMSELVTIWSALAYPTDSDSRRVALTANIGVSGAAHPVAIGGSLSPSRSSSRSV